MSRRHCAKCRRWRHITDFPPRQWADPEKTIIKYVHSECHVCRSRIERRRWANMKPHERRRRNQSSTVAHRKKRRAAGVPERGARVRATPKPGSVPREPFVRWLQEKLATPGMTLTQLADRTGIGQRNLHRFLLGYDKGGIVAGSKSQYKRRNKYRPIDWVTFETVDNAVAMYGEPWVINDLYPAEEYHPETD